MSGRARLAYLYLVKPGPVGTYRRRPGRACSGTGPGLLGPGQACHWPGAGAGRAWREWVRVGAGDVAEVDLAQRKRFELFVADPTSFFERLKTSLCRQSSGRPDFLRCGVSGVFWVWRKKVVHRSAAMVAEELDLPAEPQLPELPRPPLAAPSSKLELLRLGLGLLRSVLGCSVHPGAQPVVFTASARRRLSLRGELRPVLPLQGLAENAHVNLLRRRRLRPAAGRAARARRPRAVRVNLPGAAPAHGVLARSTDRHALVSPPAPSAQLYARPRTHGPRALRELRWWRRRTPTAPRVGGMPRISAWWSSIVRRLRARARRPTTEAWRGN